MIILLSPSKSLKKSKSPAGVNPTLPAFIDKSAALVKLLQKYSPDNLMELMAVSRSIATLNVERFAVWSKVKFEQSRLAAPDFAALLKEKMMKK